MRFWDTSAVVPLCVREPASRVVRTLTDSDPSLVVWWATRTECLSALTRRQREGHLRSEAEGQARAILTSLAESWTEVLPSENVRLRSERLLSVHALRAADAFQLAAALLWSRGNPATHAFVSFDERLREAARRENFRVLPE